MRTYIANLTCGSLAVLAMMCVPTRLSAEACQCDAGTLAQARDRAAAVFEGQVVSGPAGAPAAPGVLLRVTQTWRGPERETLRVTPKGACAPQLVPGQTYLVFASGDDDGALRVDGCSGTLRWADAGEVVATLGVGSIPVDPPVEDERRTRPAALQAPQQAGCASCAVGAASSRSTTPLPWLGPAVWALLWGLRRRRK